MQQNYIYGTGVSKMLQQNEQGLWIAICDRCGWSSKPFANKRAAINALNAHRRYCTAEKGGPSKQQEEEQEEKLVYVPNEIALCNRVKQLLSKILPKTYGVGKGAAESIIETLTPAIVSSPTNLVNHILQIAKKIPPYLATLIVNQIYTELQYEGLYQGPIPAPTTQPMTWQPMQPQQPAIYYNPLNPAYPEDYLRKRLEKVEEELQREREKRFEAELKRLEDKLNEKPDFIQQLRGIKMVLNELGYRASGKSTLDLLEHGLELLDKRAERFEQILRERIPQPQFKPEVTRTFAERREKAEEVLKAIEKAEEVLNAEDEFIDDYFNLLQKRKQKVEKVEDTGRV